MLVDVVTSTPFMFWLFDIDEASVQPGQSRPKSWPAVILSNCGSLSPGGWARAAPLEKNANAARPK